MSNSFSYVLKEGKKISDIKIIKNKIALAFLILGPLCFLFYKMWGHFFGFITVTILLAVLVNYNLIGNIDYQIYIICFNLYLAIDFANLRERFLMQKKYDLEAIK